MTTTIYNPTGVKDNCPVCNHLLFSCYEDKLALRKFFQSGYKIADRVSATLTCAGCSSVWDLHTGLLKEDS